MTKLWIIVCPDGVIGQRYFKTEQEAKDKLASIKFKDGWRIVTLYPFIK